MYRLRGKRISVGGNLLPSETAKLCLLIMKNFVSIVLDSKFDLKLEGSFR